MKSETWACLAFMAALLLSIGLLLASRGGYRDRITCENFKAEGVMVQEQDVHFHVFYADGRKVAVSGCGGVRGNCGEDREVTQGVAHRVSLVEENREEEAHAEKER